jgi:hypothetical protein
VSVGVARLKGSRSFSSRAFPLELNRALDAHPGPRRRVLQIEIRRRAPDLAQIVDELPAGDARGHMPLDLRDLGRRQRAVGVRVQRLFIRVHVTTLA